MKSTPIESDHQVPHEPRQKATELKAVTLHVKSESSNTAQIVRKGQFQRSASKGDQEKITATPDHPRERL